MYMVTGTIGKTIIDENDIIGKRLGKLTVISYDSFRYDKVRGSAGGLRLRHFYKVRCDCGTEKVVQRGPLKSEIVHSCGCSRKRVK